MEIFSIEFFLSLLSIVIIDLVLVGDNAIVIGMAAKNLPQHLQKKAVVWGTIAAVVIRALATLAVVWLLKIPALLGIGGFILIIISYKLLVQDKDHKIEAKDNIWSAIATIVVADAIMGLDNILAIAGAAHGSFLLVILGLLISVPIMVWGSTMFIKLMQKFPVIIYIGAGILAFTAAKMIAHEPLLHNCFKNNYVSWLFIALVTVGVLIVGKINKSK